MKIDSRERISQHGTCRCWDRSASCFEDLDRVVGWKRGVFSLKREKSDIHDDHLIRSAGTKYSPHKRGFNYASFSTSDPCAMCYVPGYLVPLLSISPTPHSFTTTQPQNLAAVTRSFIQSLEFKFCLMNVAILCT
jgi:hypothetical protein